MKTLNTDKLLLAVFLSGLNGVKTKELQNVDEVEQFCELKNKIEDALPKYTKAFKEKQDLTRQIRSGQLEQAEANKKSKELSDKFQKLDTKSRDKDIELKLEDSDFNLFFDLFSRKGKDFFQNPENFVSFKKDLNEANKQPKKSKK